MKRLFYLLSAMVLLCSCEGATGIDENIYNDEASIERPQCIYGVIEGENGDSKDTTRTYVANYKDVLWSKDDIISFYSKDLNNIQYIYRGEDGAASATFEFVHDLQGKQPAVDYSQAIYPYSAYAKCVKSDEPGANIVTVFYREEQDYADKSFGKGANIMVATGQHSTDDRFYFRNACGFLIIKFYGEGTVIKSLKLSALSEDVKIAGEATIISKYGAIPQITMSDNATSTVSINCGENGVALGKDAENATEFWFALPPTTFEGGFRIEAVDFYNNVLVKETTKTVEIVRNEIQPMAVIPFEKHIPEDQVIWYTRNSGTAPVTFYNRVKNPFDATIIAHYYDSEKEKFAIVFDKTVTEIKDDAFRDTNITSIELPSSIKTIGNMAFNSTKISKISFPENIKTIGIQAFQWSMITDVTIPASVESVGSEAFAGCSNLKTAHVSAKNVGKYAFYASKALESVTITANVESVGYNSFLLCASLTTVNIEESQNSLDLGYMLSDGTFEYGPFYDSPLASITLKREIKYKDMYGNPFTPDGWEEGIFANKFYDEDDLTTNVSLGVYVETISDYMFSGVRVRAIWIPKNITSIGKMAFAYCYVLNGITCNHTTPPALGDDAFYKCGVDLDGGKMWYINVLSGYAEIFKTTGNWADYADIIKEWTPTN